MTFRKLIALGCMLWLAALFPLGRAGASTDTDVLIVVAGLKFPGTNISYAALKSAYRGQRTRIEGYTVIPVNHPLNTPARVAFDRVALGLEPAAVGPFWIDMRIRDQGRPPITATTPELALRVVAALAGAITYTTQSTALENLALKVLTVNDTAPGQRGYPLTP
ncbi:MAG TPA: hypothetical protein VFN67_10610 [Polyangiales bacterium]|nr:hypothetical protein [Polyangiales bacterium]